MNIHIQVLGRLHVFISLGYILGLEFGDHVGTPLNIWETRAGAFHSLPKIFGSLRKQGYFALMSHTFKAKSFWYSGLSQNVIRDMVQENVMREIPQRRNEEETVRRAVGTAQVVVIT